jgi:hypothetical protein
MNRLKNPKMYIVYSNEVTTATFYGKFEIFKLPTDLGKYTITFSDFKNEYLSSSLPYIKSV